VHEAEARFDWLEAALPPRHVRSEAQVELQQFSTPPMLTWLMAKAAAVSAQDTLPLHEALGSLLEIETAHWWRPTAANYFDRVAKARTLEALDAAGGPELVSRYAASKKAELASAAERIFLGNFIGEADVKERAQAWVPSIMRFAGSEEVQPVGIDADELVGDDAADEIAEQAA
jgi:ParB family chromosome partitioning protein